MQLPLRGITIESVDNLDAVVAAVSAHSRVPTVRIVFQAGEPPATYAAAVNRLHPHAYLMGALLDSDALAGVTVEQARQRAQSYLTAFGDRIDIWEVGNELNGSWVGSGPADINAKVQAMYDVIVGRPGAATAITLNYWSGPDCYERSWESTLSYAPTIPASVRHGVSYLLLSMYETACDPPQQPTAAQLGTMLNTLGVLFPNARLGIGELGAQGRADGLPQDPSLAEKQRIAMRYYGMHGALRQLVGDRYAGGYFWWYYHQDAVPMGRVGSLWSTLDALMGSM
ncbi:hypothetical protein MASR1M101_27580 [Gemmatimonas sp.]